MTIYVSNLDFTVSTDDLKSLFEEFGEVESAKIITDQVSGRSRGFGFVDMPDEQTADIAMKGINGKMYKGRALGASQARERPASRKPNF